MRKQVDPEMCTAAWAKMYEMLHHFDLVPSDNPDVRSMHVCEVRVPAFHRVGICTVLLILYPLAPTTNLFPQSWLI